MRNVTKKMKTFILIDQRIYAVVVGLWIKKEDTITCKSMQEDRILSKRQKLSFLSDASCGQFRIA